MHLVALFDEELREVGAILAGDTGDKRFLVTCRFLHRKKGSLPFVCVGTRLPEYGRISNVCADFSSGHVCMRNQKHLPKWVAVSGGFDPLHIGHVRMFKEARKLGDKLVVIMNNDNWLRMKKGFTFMPQKERAEIIKNFSFVDKIVLTDHEKGDTDKSVCRTLAKVKPAIFANGGDRKPDGDPVPEVALCKKLGINLEEYFPPKKEISVCL